MKCIKKASKNIYVLSLFFTILILLIILFIKGIYPFGHNTIATGDMNQSYVTFYHFLYDIFHNGKNIFYNFELGMGSNIYGGFVSDGFFNPTSWLIVFSSRANILYNMTFIIIAKFIIVALFTTIFVQKVFPKVENKIKLLGILMYTFSGYIFVNYSNIMWIDIVALFPLFCLGIYNILKFNKMTLFTITLAFCLINNYNLAYMILFFIFFGVPFLIKYKAENKRKATMQIILGTILSVGISAFAFIPTFLQAMNSYRMAGTVTNTTRNINFFYKLFQGLFYSLPIIFLFFMIKEKKKDNNIKCILGIVLTTFLIPVLVERVNLLWHTGSYQCFGFRYGFIINFVLMIVLLYGWSKYTQKSIKFKETKKSFLKLNLSCFIVSSIFIILYLALFIAEFRNFSNPISPFSLAHSKQILYFLTIFFLSILINLYFYQKEKVNFILCFTFLLIICYGISFMGHNDALVNYEYADKSILTETKIYEEFERKDNYRIKDLTLSMPENYPLVVNVPSLSTFLHIIPSSQVNNHYQMGYSGIKTRLNDTGGTLLSDTIYGIKYMISDKEIANPLFQLQKKIDNYYIYENPYTKFIYPVNQGLKENLEENDHFQANNILIRELFQQKDVLEKLENHCQKEVKEYVCKFSLENEELYFYSDSNLDQIIINNNVITDIMANKIIDLGYFNEDITIRLNQKDLELENIHFTKLNIEKYKNIFSNLEDINFSYKGNRLTISYNNQENYKGIFIPINYDTGFHATRNKEHIEIQKKLNNFIYLELTDGENNFVLEYYPPTFKKCLLVSIITSIVIIIIYLLEKFRKQNKEKKWITIPFYILGIIIVSAATLKVYIIPIVQTIINLF